MKKRSANTQDHGFAYCKLHGSLDTDIIPPTWNKYGNEIVRQSWAAAYNLIKEATQIRILGYSLPKSDNYVKYLMAIGLKNTYNVKNIDIITLDNDTQTRIRYQETFCFNRLRYKNDNINSYVNSMVSKRIAKIIRGQQFPCVEFNAELFEEEHHKYMLGTT